MPVEWAIAQSDLTLLDRFTVRCRVPLNSIQLRPRWASPYVVYKPDASQPEVFICQIAIAPPEETSRESQRATLDRTVEISTATRPALIKRLASHAADSQVNHVRGMHWIPRESIRIAGGVTLEVDVDNVDGGRAAAQVLLADVGYRQLLHETMQHQLAVCKLAVVRLPLPDSVRHGTGTLPCRVVSTYPAEDFVRVATTTRVTITLPDEEQEGASDTIEAVDETETETRDDETAMRTSTRVGGLEKELQALCEMIMLPITKRSIQEQYGIEFPKGALLCGPPGVGKSLLVRTAVEECRQHVPLHLQIINGSEIMTSGIGEAEQTLRGIFRTASTQARESDGAAVIFIDELDALCPKRDSQGTMAHSRIVAQLLTLLDGADATQSRENVLIIGATNLPNNIDAALRRPGRFDREVFVAPPDIHARKKIFAVHMADLPYVVRGAEPEKQAFVETLAKKAIGYVGADIAALCREALSVASTRQFVQLTKNQELHAWWDDWKRHGRSLQVTDIEKMVAGIAWQVSPISIPVWFLTKPAAAAATANEQLPASKPVEYFRYLFQGLRLDDQSSSAAGSAALSSSPTELSLESTTFEVTMDDFDQAMNVIVASALRSATGATKGVEQLGWDSIGGQEETKLALQQALEWPIKFPQTFTRLGITPPRGVLLYGPPGCSKSTVVRAAAHASGATFLSLSAAQVFSPFFGDAEASVRQVFRDARAALPAIVFFDEIDVLVTKREFDGASAGSSSGSGSGSTALRVLSTMLNEMDGVESADGLLVIGATNRPDCIDAALLRPGRFDRIVFVDLPSEMDRFQILKIHTRGMALHDDVALGEIAVDADHFSGAELENVCREAALHALRESIHADCVCMRHFRSAMRTITPVSSPASLEAYFEFAARMG